MGRLRNGWKPAAWNKSRQRERDSSERCRNRWSWSRQYQLASTSSLVEKATALVTFKPIWGAFFPSSPGYWLQHTVYPNPFASLSFMNPLFFLAGSIFVVIGLCRRWLSAYEILLACCLLLIPYVASSYEMHMAGMARFVAAIFPLHLVLGQIFTRLRGPRAVLLLSVSDCFLALYAALFAAWYQVY